MKRKLRMGMIGGGKNAFIGAVHRIAANMDGLIELTCGALSSDPANAIESGKLLFLPEDRIYKSYEDMIKAESKLPAGERMDFVSIVTPNHVHFHPAMMALDHGFHVVLDKPMTFTLDEAKQLEKKVKETGRHLCLTHTYSGYPLVKQARQMVQQGVFGKIRKVYVEYPQGWLTHATHLAEYISGLKITQLCADLHIMVEGRALDDDGNVLLRFDKGANGVLIASQVAAGEENPLKIRVYGEKGGLEWAQQEPNTLLVKWLDQPTQILRAGGNYSSLSSFALHNSRTPGGHPEGYLEAFANIYRNFALTVSAVLEGEKPSPEMLDFPTATEGVRGMAFIDNVVKSSERKEKWTEFEV